LFAKITDLIGYIGKERFSMRFTPDEFQIALRELFVEEPACFDTLCVIAEKELMPAIRGWCADDNALRGRDCECDIMQDTLVRIIKYCITGFFLRDGRNSPNTDMQEFCRWIYTVARNVKRDYSNSYRERIIVDYSELEGRIGDELGEEFVGEELASVFDITFSLKMGVHKLLAWLAVSVVILNETDKRNVATEIVVNRFGKATLDEMLEFLLRELRRYPNLLPTDSELAGIRKLLDEPDELGVRTGDRPFYTFFMAKGGKYSVSDWLHKINQLIKRNYSW